MSTKMVSGAFLAAAVALIGWAPAPAHAMTAQECYNNFRAERKAGDLKNMDYQQFRSARCALDTKAPAAKASKTATAPATASAAGQAAAPATATQSQPVPDPRPSVPAATTPAAPTAAPANSVTPSGQGRAVFPAAVAAQYANLKPGRARMQTCLDQYRANKAGNGNGGLRWIQKGGGYYSECNRRLKQ